MARLPALAVFLHSGDYDRVHQGLSIAAAAAASGREVDVFFFWWALERLVQDRLDAPDLREDVADRFETWLVPTLRQLLSHLRELGGAKLYACSGSIEIVGADREKLSGCVDQVVGWSWILQRTAGVVDRFYL
jgi:peroxiredoxin family protein